MRSLLALLPVLLLSCAPPRDPMSPNVDPVVAEEYDRTVGIDVDCPTGAVSGTGVRIGGHAVITAMHVVTCGGRVRVLRQGGMTYDAEVVGLARADLARLDVPGMVPVPQVDLAAPATGDRACEVSWYPERGRRCGELWPSSDDAEGGGLRADFVAEHGNSGAGLWDPAGRLLGIVTRLRPCRGTFNGQICGAGATAIAPRSWIAAP